LDTAKEKVSASESKINDVRSCLKEILAKKQITMQSIKGLEIFVDASTTGWSATIEEKCAFRNWENNHRHTDITFLKSMAMLLSLESFTPTIAHHHIT
ncbi:21140_t:CDS:2, partial [Cetraspora pellucida]